ncbi:MAG: hypothetical protein Q8R61_04795 [Thiobacillus sp.]|uniref:hypothetical protein n=1 Tax=Thiobacillus sp. TaxID=924 RepID=UPI002735DD64|nr:hypothetical protein [Thiobacillus sp.]MDP3584420.1 hypothetical protein [Thiobacillus sp.]
MFKHTVIAVLLGLLCAGNAQAVTYGSFGPPGFTDRDTMGERARGFGGATLKPAPADFQDGSPDTPAPYDASGIAMAEVGVTRDVKEFSDLAISIAPWAEPNAKDWLLILAGIGLVGLMVDRNRRRLF